MESQATRMTAKEKFLSCNTLVCLVQALVGHRTTVELRNEAEVYGTVDHVDGHMNVTLSGATFTDPAGNSAPFASFFVHGRQIRYVHIPQQVSPMAAIREQLAVNQRGGKVGRQEETDQMRRSRRTKKAQAYTRETVRAMGQPQMPSSGGPPQMPSRGPPQLPPQMPSRGTRGPTHVPRQMPPGEPSPGPLQRPPRMPSRGTRGPSQMPPQIPPWEPSRGPPQMPPRGPSQIPPQIPPWEPSRGPPQMPPRGSPQMPPRIPPWEPSRGPPQMPPRGSPQMQPGPVSSGRQRYEQAARDLEDDSGFV